MDKSESERKRTGIYLLLDSRTKVREREGRKKGLSLTNLKSESEGNREIGREEQTEI